MTDRLSVMSGLYGRVIYTVALGKKEFNGLKYYWVTNSFLHMMHMRCNKMVKNEVMTLNKQSF